MKLLTPMQLGILAVWFLPEQPGPVIGSHVLQTGHGAGWADRWPQPRVLLIETSNNYALLGDADALNPSDLRGLIQGMVTASPDFKPLLQAVFPNLLLWDRVIYTLADAPNFTVPAGTIVRRLTALDAYHLWGLLPDSRWIVKTWGGAAGLAGSGCAWGGFVNGRLASVACTFFMGYDYEEIGVITETEFRGRGLSGACAGALCQDIQARGKRPSWTTSLDNAPSKRVAEKLGFVLHRQDVLYVINSFIPEPPQLLYKSGRKPS
jgi:predicted GNAT family acetyltransferase